jgi:hypothetical protein
MTDAHQTPPRLSRRKLIKYAGAGATMAAAGGLIGGGTAWANEVDGRESARRGDPRGRSWQAGDHHVHSEFSGSFDTTVSPPRFIRGTDGVYPIVTNAIMAKNFGLSWVMCADHGGTTHARVSLQQAYPELLRSRRLVPEVLQFWGMELNAPAQDHHTLMIPHHDGEEQQLFELESRFEKFEPLPFDPSRDTEAKMIEFLQVANAMDPKPLVLAHHPCRSSGGLGVFGQDTPREFRNGNNAAPEVYIGFEGAPGHQAGPLVGGPRGTYGFYQTHGGFDQMTAIVGGVWDSLLGEGRRWWITANSDSHVHWTRGGLDFWPGEYSKTHVLARHDYGDIVDGLRNGRVFVAAGDLITSLGLAATNRNRTAGMGETLSLSRANRNDVDIEIKFRPLTGLNGNGERPTVQRVDLIVGEVTGPNPDLDAASNPSTSVVARFGPSDWRKQGADYVMRHTLRDVQGDLYARLRGTNTDQLEPLRDGFENDAWSDLWFYSNPVFVHLG